MTPIDFLLWVAGIGLALAIAIVAGERISDYISEGSYFLRFIYIQARVREIREILRAQKYGECTSEEALAKIDNVLS